MLLGFGVPDLSLRIISVLPVDMRTKTPHTGTAWVFMGTEQAWALIKQSCVSEEEFLTETIPAGCKLASDRILTVRISRDRRGEISGLANA